MSTKDVTPFARVSSTSHVPVAVPVTTTLSALQTSALQGPVVATVGSAVVLQGSSIVASPTSSGQLQAALRAQHAIATSHVPLATIPAAGKPVNFRAAKVRLV